MITLESARDVVRQTVLTGSDKRSIEQRAAIAKRMAETGTCVVHAAWELYGRPKGLPCHCSPCMLEKEVRKSCPTVPATIA